MMNLNSMTKVNVIVFFFFKGQYLPLQYGGKVYLHLKCLCCLSWSILLAKETLNTKRATWLTKGQIHIYKKKQLNYFSVVYKGMPIYLIERRPLGSE